MNQQLSNIQLLIQRSALSIEEKEKLLKEILSADKQWNIIEFKLDRTEKVKRTTAILLEQTIEELEQKRKAIEAQNHELEIEASLERVRAVALSMMKPEDMLDVCKTIAHQLELLHVKEIRNVQTGIFYETKGTYTNYEFYAKHDKVFITEVDYKNHPIAEKFANQMLKGRNEVFIHKFKDKEVKDWLDYQKTTNVFIDSYLENADTLNYYWYSLGPVAIGMSTYAPLPDAEIELFKRFRNVFELAYRRYLDIEQAEAQAKEAKIEAALEKIRARSLAMHHADELKDVITVVREKLKELDVAMESRTVLILTLRKDSKDFTQWVATPEDLTGNSTLGYFETPYFDHPILKDFWSTKESGLNFFSKAYTPEQKKSFFEFLFENTDGRNASDEEKKWVLQPGAYAVTAAIENNSAIIISNFSNKLLSEKESEILKRFAKVFEQAYIRFLDLQKAEAQAREAQIEAALEKIRSSSLAMHHSDEIINVVTILFEKLKDLGLIFDGGAGIILFTEGSRDAVIGVISPELGAPTFHDLPYDEKAFVNNPIALDVWKAKDEGVDIINTCYSLEHKNKYFEYVFKHNDESKLPQPLREFIFNTKSYTATFIAEKNSLLGVNSWTEQFLSKENIAVLRRVARVFEQAYVRFLDLKKAEAQARESQIQLALERVRARTMAMQKSDELPEAARELFQQVQSLGISSWATGYCIWDDDKRAITAWMHTEGVMQPPMRYPTTEEELFIQMWKGFEEGKSLHVVEMGGDELAAHYSYMYTLPGAKQMFESIIESGHPLPTFQIMHYAYFSKGFLMFITYEPVPESHDIFIRFAKVFEQTYTRFLDLQKAEAQAREAEIELGLERVRARAMAMQNSDELSELIATVFNELTKLDLVLTRCVILIYEGNEKGVRWWMANSEAPSTPMSFFVKYADLPFFDEYLKAWRERSIKWQYLLEGENKVTTDDFLFTQTELSLLPHFVISGMRAPDRVYLNASFNNFGNLTLASLAPLSGEHFDILLRFAKVFDLTYTRFNDLKQAEAQAREAQIQLALERVRARTMAMQKSEELTEVAELLFKQVNDLGIKTWTTGFNVWSEDNNYYTDYITNPQGGFMPPYTIDARSIPVSIKLINARKSGEEYYVNYEEGESLAETYSWLMKFGPKQFTSILESGFKFPSQQYEHFVFGSKVSLMFITYDLVAEEAHDIFKRFGKVFEQTYTRFLDLQKAEAQAREAQIEAALEKVRSRSLAMHHSKELSEVVTVVFQKLKELNFMVNDGAAIILTFTENSKDHIEWVADPTQSYSMSFKIPYSNHSMSLDFINARESGATFFSKVYSFEEKNAYFNYLFQHTDYKHLSDDTKSVILESEHVGLSVAFQKNSAINIPTNIGKLLTDEQQEILKRFAKVFEQSYTRFLDLQKAEAQAREAQIETALEKVRSRTLAMQKSSELAETAAVLFRQLSHLGIEPNRLYINIVKDENGEAEFWITDEDGSKVSMAYEDNMNNNPTFKKMYDGWKQQKRSLIIDMNGRELEDYFIYLNSIHVPFKGGLSQKRRVQYIAYFSKGFIGMASPDEQPAETMQLLERFAGVFNLTFTRFNDLKVAEAHALQAEQDLIEIKAAKKKAEDAFTELQAAQRQLVQSEKMASLGELTAGIAHEIQNPLNFVNNFSDVSNELLEEMKTELKKGNTEEALTIVNDVKGNLEKILHHGKRADAIVKGMLQHSRTSTGQKELTDINALCDEYLRLSYHGLRAKDKSFNAKFMTDFDKNAGKIDVMPQEIGRVILNLINNAFYTVNEKAKLQTAAYEPLVSISTKKDADKIFITIADNGNGIPQKNLEKIFQPFFTTKPTGQGTGLGLSLAYDIITKGHNGEIKVEAKEGEGSKFMIIIPSI